MILNGVCFIICLALRKPVKATKEEIISVFDVCGAFVICLHQVFGIKKNVHIGWVCLADDNKTEVKQVFFVYGNKLGRVVCKWKPLI